jgi:hypothetical protein
MAGTLEKVIPASEKMFRILEQRLVALSRLMT